MPYDFNQFGHVMNVNMKIAKHVSARNCNRVKDYICSAYDTFNPSKETYKNHPCFEMLSKGVDFLKTCGWKVGVAPWKEIGEQVIIVSPDGDYYHSKFDHGVKKQDDTPAPKATVSETPKNEVVVERTAPIITTKSLMRTAFRNAFRH